MRQALIAGSALAAAAAIAAGVVIASREDGKTVALPRCARPAATIPRPVQLPPRFRFPRGTVFTSVRRNFASRGVPLIRGLMPLDLDGAARFLDDLPGAGVSVTLRRQRPERGLEAHYNVTGFGGFFKVNALRACRGATAFSISARPTLLGRSGHAE
jgi:hypothetical protein